MAYNKEYIIFVLDVRQTASEEFKQKSIKCCSDVLKQKICCGKKDYVSFALVGTNDTQNDMNSTINGKKYKHIYQCDGELLVPSWKVLMNFYQFVNETAGNGGEWLDAIVVALGMLKKGAESAKIQRLRIALFYDFNDGHNSYDEFVDIANSLLTEGVELIVISPNISYIDNAANDNLPQAIFADCNGGNKKHSQQLENEKYALRLVCECNAKLCNLNEALITIVKSKSKRPWCWNSTLRIGSKITIKICGIIACKNECTIKLKKVWAEPDEKLTREWAYFIHGNQVCPDEDNLIDGYMLGGSGIAYDESLKDEKIKLPPGLTFLGFIPRKSVYDEYFTGESTYLILHQKGMQASAKKMDALVRALLKFDRAILCWKVYSEKFNRPRIVILLPSEIQEDCSASFQMLEVAHHAQYHFFDFPKLSTKNTECSDEQLNAIDQLIDSMDLTLKSKDGESQRVTFEKDVLPFDKLPHIFEKNFMDLMERKILCKAVDDDELFQQMLKDKNFVEVFWKLPEEIEKEAKTAVKNVKKLFPLEESREWLDKLKAQTNANSQATNNNNNNNNEAESAAVLLDFDHVRSSTPAEDFEQLLTAYVLPLKDNTARDVKFNHYASQIRSVIKTLILKEQRSDFEKIRAALSAYRKKCFVFNAFHDYNKWISIIRTEVEQRQLSGFWEDVIATHELGLCFAPATGEPTLEEQIKEKDFYNLEFSSEKNSNLSELNDSEMNNLLATMEDLEQQE